MWRDMNNLDVGPDLFLGTLIVYGKSIEGNCRQWVKAIGFGFDRSDSEIHSSYYGRFVPGGSRLRWFGDKTFQRATAGKMSAPNNHAILRAKFPLFPAGRILLYHLRLLTGKLGNIPAPADDLPRLGGAWPILNQVCNILGQYPCQHIG